MLVNFLARRWGAEERGLHVRPVKRGVDENAAALHPVASLRGEDGVQHGLRVPCLIAEFGLMGGKDDGDGLSIPPDHQFAFPRLKAAHIFAHMAFEFMDVEDKLVRFGDWHFFFLSKIKQKCGNREAAGGIGKA